MSRNTKLFSKYSLFFAVCVVVIAGGARADVSYSLGQATELLDSAFYAGEASDGSDAAGRMAFWGGTSHSGTTVAFWALNAATYQHALFLVDIGYPSSWRRLTSDISGTPEIPIMWSPDDQYILSSKWRVPVATGEWTSYSVFGQTPWESTIALFSTGYLLFHSTSALPVLANGAEDLTRELTEILNFSDPALSITWTTVASDCSAMAFVDFHKVSGVPDRGDIYVLRNLQDVLNAAKISGTDISSLAPTSLADSNIVEIRASETTNPAIAPCLSADNSLVIYSEDQNNIFQANQFFSTMFLADFDIMISRIDGSGADLRLAREGNQGAVSATPGGTRLLYIGESDYVMHLYVSTLEVATPVVGDPVGDPEDNMVETSTEVTASDASGTEVVIPANTTVDFPDSAAQEIQITTPIDPIETPDLPFEVEAVPVVREFGPDGTVFSEPITITITYADAEVAGYDESALRIYTYNPDTGKFDVEITTIVARDIVNNTISFTVTHFSTYGLTALRAEMPLDISVPVTVALLCAGMMCMGGWLRRKVRTR